MKNNLITTILTWVLAAGLLLSMFFSVKFFFQTKQFRTCQMEISRYQNTHNGLNVLLNDLVEYSRRDRGIEPILESVGVRVTRTAPGATTNKPAAK
jgi:hypothetical protein